MVIANILVAGCVCYYRNFSNEISQFLSLFFLILPVMCLYNKYMILSASSCNSYLELQHLNLSVQQYLLLTELILKLSKWEPKQCID